MRTLILVRCSDVEAADRLWKDTMNLIHEDDSFYTIIRKAPCRRIFFKNFDLLFCCDSDLEGKSILSVGGFGSTLKQMSESDYVTLMENFVREYVDGVQ